VTLTVPEKPFTGDTDTVNGLLEAPGETEILEGEIVRLKFGETVIWSVRLVE
jgi:hypothetical protein